MKLVKWYVLNKTDQLRIWGKFKLNIKMESMALLLRQTQEKKVRITFGNLNYCQQLIEDGGNIF